MIALAAVMAEVPIKNPSLLGCLGASRGSWAVPTQFRLSTRHVKTSHCETADIQAQTFPHPRRTVARARSAPQGIDNLRVASDAALMAACPLSPAAAAALTIRTARRG